MAQLRCPDDVSGDIGGCSARRALKPKFCVSIVFFPPMPPHVLVDFVVLPPGHVRSVTD